MGRLTGHYRDDLVLWAYARKDKFNQPTISPGIVMRGRWIEKIGETLSADNTVIRYDVTVKSPSSVAIGSIMWKGRYRNLPSPISSVTNLFQVHHVDKIPNLKNRETRFTLYLIRYSDTLPTIV